MKRIPTNTGVVVTACVFAIALSVFLLTVAPTVSFWDCGEYVGAAHSLGVPHPPGNPLYVMLGRVFSMLLFFFSQVAYRINLISVLASAFTALFLYLIVVRVMTSWVGEPDQAWKRITIYVSGSVGALFGVFGTTFWSSAVEAEVIASSMLVIVICTWLALVWAQSRHRDRLLILFVYVAFLGIGIHMFSMIALIPIFPFVLLCDRSKLKDWRIWLCGLLMGTVIYHVSAFLWIGPLLALVTATMMWVSQKAKAQWRFCFFIVLFALLGYSVHLYIPIRSALKPIIDENHPVIEWTPEGVRWDAFRGFLERKQYGSESMIARMFWRRGSWGKQLGIDGHMGYGGFHLTQFFHFGKTIDTDRENSLFQTWGSVRGTLYLLVYLVPTLLMLFGWYYLYKRRRNEALLLILLVLLTTIGLVLYMNFADGHHAEKRDYQMWLRSGRQGPMPTVYREVRVRDYFFTPGFMFFGMWIGVASGCLLHFLYTSTRRLLRTHIAPVASVFFALSPLLPIAQNFAGNDRSRDWVPYDYAYNLLMSCKRDAILITNGDNDTFPLWFLQEAEGIRRDVRVVNLSLLNTTWYIKQLKELQPRVPISFSDARIDALNAELNPLAEPTVYKQAGAGITIQIPGRNQMHVLRVQDKALLNIVDTNRWRKPIYFAATVSNDNMLGLQPYLQMQGLGYEILPQRVPAEQRLDVERTVFLLDKVYRFTGLGQTKRPLNETTIQMLSNYAACFLQVVIQMRDSLANLADTTAALEQALAAGPGSDSAETLRDARAAAQTRYREKLDFVVTKLNQCVDIMPWDWRPRALRHEMLLAHGRTEEALEKLREARRIEPGNIQYMKMEVQTLDKLGRHTDAAEVLKDLARSDLDSWEVHALLCTRYEELGLWDSAIWVMQQFQRRHPGDRRAEAMMARLTAVGGAALQRRSESTTRMD